MLYKNSRYLVHLANTSFPIFKKYVYISKNKLKKKNLEYLFSFTFLISLQSKKHIKRKSGDESHDRN